jgi:hypothetical protein
MARYLGLLTCHQHKLAGIFYGIQNITGVRLPCIVANNILIRCQNLENNVQKVMQKLLSYGIQGFAWSPQGSETVGLKHMRV